MQGKSEEAREAALEEAMQCRKPAFGLTLECVPHAGAPLQKNSTYRRSVLAREQAATDRYRLRGHADVLDYCPKFRQSRDAGKVMKQGFKDYIDEVKAARSRRKSTHSRWMRAS